MKINEPFHKTILFSPVNFVTQVAKLILHKLTLRRMYDAAICIALVPNTVRIPVPSFRLSARHEGSTLNRLCILTRCITGYWKLAGTLATLANKPRKSKKIEVSIDR